MLTQASGDEERWGDAWVCGGAVAAVEHVGARMPKHDNNCGERNVHSATCSA